MMREAALRRVREKIVREMLSAGSEGIAQTRPSASINMITHPVVFRKSRWAKSPVAADLQI